MHRVIASEPWTWLARIRRPQGRKGEVLAELLTDFPEKFSERRRLWLIRENGVREPREVELINHWMHKTAMVLHFAGIDSISAAETLAGLIVAIPSSQRAPLGEDELYLRDLVGCTIFDVAAGREVRVGEIEEVDRDAGPAALLVVRGAKGEVLVPFAKSYLQKIDIGAKRIEMALPEGLTDLNKRGKP